jgi:hypothetical protein
MPEAASNAAATRAPVLTDFDGRYGSASHLDSLIASVSRTFALRPGLFIGTVVFAIDQTRAGFMTSQVGDWHGEVRCARVQ